MEALCRKDLVDLADSLHTQLSSIKTDLETLKADMHVIQRFKTKMEAVEARESEITESELNNAIRHHLERVYPAYKLTDLSNKFKTVKHHMTGQRLTDFDGIFELSQTMGKALDKRIVIIEAKRYIDDDKMLKKLHQMKVLSKMVRIAKSGNFMRTTRVFRDTVKALKLQEYDPTILFFAGAAIWQRRCQSG